MTPNEPSPDTANAPAPGDRPAVQDYEIRVTGRLPPRWSAWFDGLELEADSDGTTVIRGPVPDQAALHGLLQKLRDIGIPVLSLTPVPARQSNAPRAHPNQKEN